MRDRARIAVLVSGGGTNLQALLDREKAGDLPHGEICLVVSNRKGAYALERARKADLPALYIPRKKGEGPAFEEKLLTALKEEAIDLVVLAGFLAILSEDFLRAFAGPILNIHPSLIPSFCGPGYYGLKVHEAALERGVRVTGATVHLVNAEPDGGPILLQKAVEVRPDDSPETLQKRVMEEAEWILLPRATEDLAREIVTRRSGEKNSERREERP
ncbi:phosphoribosylglycinamide formyltransferase [Kallipyga massiliensis]|uniref:phosphoribosylglycinamide formyltransferase n=1 Tax=Kallipyga massiliensis TaxID=1472764 RepID=UPI0004B50D90|nr:phosphoribosylglycinamide formyltransferase [Kallipyga massiliensis]